MASRLSSSDSRWPRLWYGSAIRPAGCWQLEVPEVGLNQREPVEHPARLGVLAAALEHGRREVHADDVHVHARRPARRCGRRRRPVPRRGRPPPGRRPRRTPDSRASTRPSRSRRCRCPRSGRTRRRGVGVGGHMRRCGPRSGRGSTMVRARRAPRSVRRFFTRSLVMRRGSSNALATVGTATTGSISTPRLARMCETCGSARMVPKAAIRRAHQARPPCP